MDNSAPAKVTANQFKPNNIINVDTSIDDGFFKWWCTFLRPFIKLTDKEAQVMASFLKQRWLLSKQILDLAILDKVILNKDTKKKVAEDCHISLTHLYVVMDNFRKNKVIVDGRINPRLIPNIKEEGDSFKLLILFKNKS